MLGPRTKHRIMQRTRDAAGRLRRRCLELEAENRLWSEAEREREELRAVVRRQAAEILAHETTEVRLLARQRLYAALSQTNLAIFQIRQEQALYQRICAIASEFGEQVLVWIALEGAPGQELRVAASSGSPREYLDGITLRTAQNPPFGQGPAGTAMRLEKSLVSNAFRTDPAFLAWRAKAERFGIEAVAAFPIRRAGRVVGALCVHADRPGFFDPQSVALLERITGALSFALDAIDREAALLRLNEELEERIRRRTALLESANAELDAFSYSVSHDLRAPLRSIDGFSQALLEDCGGELNDGARHLLARIRAGVQRMGLLINDLLQLSKVSRGALRPQALELSGMARELLDELARGDPGRSPAIRIDPGLGAWGDPGLVRSVLANLLGNAWKYTAKAPEARIEVRAEAWADGQPGICVRDNGAGFDMAHAAKLFTPFQRLHSAAEFEGSGIGLTIVQRILHRHGGRIMASGAIGAGAAFCFTLPGPADPEAGAPNVKLG